MREEEVAGRFGRVIGAIRMDDDMLHWVTTTLKGSFQDKTQNCQKQFASLQTQYKRIQLRLETMYMDKLEGRIDQDFFDRKSSEWKTKLNVISRKIEKHKNANHAYQYEGLKLLELGATCCYFV